MIILSCLNGGRRDTYIISNLYKNILKWKEKKNSCVACSIKEMTRLTMNFFYVELLKLVLMTR